MDRKEYIAINTWIRRGVKEPKWKLKKIYDYKLTLPNCERCHCFFRDSYDKTLHHIHDTGKYVGIYCQDCNKMFRELSLPTTGFTHIHYRKIKGALYYSVTVQRNRKQYNKYFSMHLYTLDQVIEYRDILYQILYII